MKIFITHVYSRENAGDAAILSVLISEIKKEFTNPEMTISTMEDLSRVKTYEDIPLVSSFISLTLKRKSRSARLLNLVYVISISLIWVILYKVAKIKANFLLTKKLKELLTVLSQSDLIIPVGGGYLRGTNNILSTANLCLLLFPLYLGKLLNKVIVLHSQSIGPFGNRTQEWVAKVVLNKVDLLILREDISIQLLKKIGVKKEKLVRSVDAGFIFSSQKTFNLRKNVSPEIGSKKDPIVGITVRQWLDPESQAKYEQQMAEFIDYLTTKKSKHVILIPQVTADMHQDDDRTICINVINKLKKKKKVWFINNKLSHYELKSIYSQLQYIIGTRFHSIIFSLTSYVPAIAIEYEHKTSGIMKDLGLAEWVVKIEDVTAEKLIKKFEKLEKEQRAYSKVLESKIPSYVVQAKDAVKMIKNKSDK